VLIAIVIGTISGALGRALYELVRLLFLKLATHGSATFQSVRNVLMRPTFWSEFWSSLLAVFVAGVIAGVFARYLLPRTNTLVVVSILAAILTSVIALFFSLARRKIARFSEISRPEVAPLAPRRAGDSDYSITEVQPTQEERTDARLLRQIARYQVGADVWLTPTDLAGSMGLSTTNHVINASIMPSLLNLQKLGLVELRGPVNESQLTSDGQRLWQEPVGFGATRRDVPLGLVKAVDELDRP
jgi:hypothetical protein